MSKRRSETDEERRQLIDAYTTKLLASAPPLSPEQQAVIRRVLGSQPEVGTVPE